MVEVGRSEGESAIDSGHVVEVLGACRVMRASTQDEIPLTGLQRRIMCRLALSAPDAVLLEDLAESTWPNGAPSTARAALHNQISRIRSATDDGLIVTSPGAYRLSALTDLAEVTETVRAAARLVEGGQAESAYEAANVAIARFRGAPLNDLENVESLAGPRNAAAGLLSWAEEIRLTAALELGSTAWAVIESERLVSARPTNEGLWMLHVRALEAAGRRGDALGAVDRARRVLRDQLGIEPGAPLRDLGAAILSGGGDTTPRSRQPVRGRTRELDDIVAEASAGGRVIIEGGDGMGKSTVAGEATRRLRSNGVRVASAFCHDNPATPLPVLMDLLDELGVEADRALGPIDGFIGAVERLAATHRIAIVVEDLHLAGPSTIRTLDRCSLVPKVSLVATAARPVGLGEAGGGDPLTVRLGPLDDATITAIVTDFLPAAAALDELQLSALVGMCGGNPFIARCLGERVDQVPDSRESGYGASTPAALADFVHRRLDRLDSDTCAAVEIAAVCGSLTNRSVLTTLAGEAGVRAAVAAGVLRVDESERIAFCEGVVERVLYYDLTPGRRTELHHAVALLEQQHDAPNSSIAHHLLAAAELDPAAARTAAMAAGSDASANGAHRDAAEWFARAAMAARLLGPGGARLAVAAEIARGDALRLAGDPTHPAILLDAADEAEQMDDGPLLGDAAFALLQLGATSESGGMHARAIEVATRALDAVAGTEQWAVVAAAASLAQSLTGNAELSRELFLQAEESAISPEIRRWVLPFTYLGLGLPADLDRRTALATELNQLGTSADDPIAVYESHHLGFSNALQQADGEGARSHLGQMEDLVEQVGDVGRRWQLRYAIAAIAHLDDDLERSEQLATDAMALFSPVSESRAFAAFGSQLLMLRLAQGRIAELRDVLEVLAVEQPGVPAWHAALALASVEEDGGRSARHARTALEGAEVDFTWLPLHLIGARAVARLGDIELAGRYLDRISPHSGLVGWQGTCAFGPVDTCVALLQRSLGNRSEATEAARRAFDVARSLQAPVFERELVDEGFDGS